MVWHLFNFCFQLPGMISLSSKFIPTIMNLMRKLAEEGQAPAANNPQRRRLAEERQNSAANNPQRNSSENNSNAASSSASSNVTSLDNNGNGYTSSSKDE